MGSWGYFTLLVGGAHSLLQVPYIYIYTSPTEDAKHRFVAEFCEGTLDGLMGDLRRK